MKHTIFLHKNNLTTWFCKLTRKSSETRVHLDCSGKCFAIVPLYSGGLVKRRFLKIDMCSCSDPALAGWGAPLTEESKMTNKQSRVCVSVQQLHVIAASRHAGMHSVKK